MEQTNPLANPTTAPPITKNQLVKSSLLKKPIFIVLLVILLVVLSSLVTYFIVKSQTKSQALISSPAPSIQTSPTPSIVDETVNWKTYTSEPAGFSIKYPSEWIEDFQVVSGWLDLKSPDGKSSISFNGGPKGGMVGTDTIDNFCQTRNRTNTVLEKNNLTIDNNPVAYCIDRNAYKVYFLAPGSNNQYEITGSFNKDNFGQYLNIYIKMLSTFRFLDTAQVNPTADWKTYNSPEIGDYFSPFQISYPPTWTIEQKLNSQEPKSLTLTLKNSNSETIQILQAIGGGGTCVYYNDSDYTNFEGMGAYYSSYNQLNKPALWRISQLKDKNETSRVICEKTKNRYIDGTKIGWIRINIKSEISLQEVKSILEKIVFKPTPTTKTLFD